MSLIKQQKDIGFGGIEMTRRKGMMVGKGKKGYHNVMGKDPYVHSQSARGIKQPQRIPQFIRSSTSKANLIFEKPVGQSNLYRAKFPDKGTISVHAENVVEAKKKVLEQLKLDEKTRAFINAGLNNVWLNRSADISDGNFVCEDFLEPKMLKEVKTINELKTEMKKGNWSINTGFIYKDLAFINQINGGDEWATFKYVPELKTAFQFESISAIPIIRDKEFNKMVKDMHRATPEQVRKLDY